MQQANRAARRLFSTSVRALEESRYGYGYGSRYSQPPYSNNGQQQSSQYQPGRSSYGGQYSGSQYGRRSYPPRSQSQYAATQYGSGRYGSSYQSQYGGQRDMGRRMDQSPSYEMDREPVEAKVKVQVFLSHKGNIRVDVRKWVEKNGETFPLRKGLNMSVEDWQLVKKLTPEIDESIKALERDVERFGSRVDPTSIEPRTVEAPKEEAAPVAAAAAAAEKSA